MVIVDYKISKENLLFFLIFSLSFLILVTLSIIEYTKLANFRNKISYLEEEIRKNQILKTELINQYIQLTSFENFKDIVKENNLILISKPKYLKID